MEYLEEGGNNEACVGISIYVHSCTHQIITPPPCAWAPLPHQPNPLPTCWMCAGKRMRACA